MVGEESVRDFDIWFPFEKSGRALSLKEANWTP